jgi:type IV secretory pathway TraG/TraD family ATPase VirD4
VIRKAAAATLVLLVLSLLIRHVIIVGLLVGAFLVGAGLAARWALWPTKHLPHNRVRHLRIRLHLRLHPGRGHATAFEVFWRWGRFAAFRESKRTRPGLTRAQRLCDPQSHSLFLGRGHYRLSVRVTVQEHGAIIGPPRSYKSALLSRVIMAAPGSVVNSSSKPDQFMLTSGLRARRGPVWVFNPQGIGGVPSNVRWSPLDGCLEPATAIRRADAFSLAVSTSGAEDGSFWSGKASDGMRGIFAAAAMTGRDMRQVGRWAGSAEVAEAVAILAAAGHDEWAAQLAELTGPAEKTAATVRMVMSRAVAFLNDPALASATLPAPGHEFSIDEFLTSGGTLYLLARGNGEESVLAPLFAALAAEIQHRAVQIGSRMPGGRLDPPLLMALDEVTQICPVPLPQWLADSGGQGVTIWTAFHGLAQLRARWKEAGAQTVLDTSNCKVFLPGLTDTATLSAARELSGKVSFRRRGQDEQYDWIDVLTPDMIRQLPAGFALILRNNLTPVIARLARGWEHRPYKRLARRNEGRADVAVPPVDPAQQPRAVNGVGLVLGDTRELEDALPASSAPPVANGHANGYPWSAR